MQVLKNQCDMNQAVLDLYAEMISVYKEASKINILGAWWSTGPDLWVNQQVLGPQARRFDSQYDKLGGLVGIT